MRYENVEQILEANGAVRGRLLQMLTEISEDEAEIIPDGEKWSIRQIVEHVAMVGHGVSRICGRLISEAKRFGTLSDGTLAISPEFLQNVKRAAGEKLEAPEQVQPTGKVSILDSVEMIKGSQLGTESMRQDLQAYDLTKPKFPHPYFGDLTAIEWLIVAGGHEMRHTRQIERILGALRQ